MLDTAVNATRSPKKATNWRRIKNGESSKEIKLAEYQSIDKKHLCVYVKFEGGLSIPFTKKMRSKKVKLFQGDDLSFLEMAGCEN
jgi:hypothetical protein